VSYSPFNRLQLDIFVLTKYEYYNKGYGYILCIIDIFSRKVWAYPMKGKSLSDTSPAIKRFSVVLDYMNLIVKRWSLL
jgi:hypothetical protein